MDESALINSLEKTLREINTQINLLWKDAETAGVQIEELKNPRGDYLVIPLLTSKAQVLSALASLRRR